jgi:hypothetical protein
MHKNHLWIFYGGVDEILWVIRRDIDAPLGLSSHMGENNLVNTQVL